MNRCMRDPHVQWCERRTPSCSIDGAAYSIMGWGSMQDPSRLRRECHAFATLRQINDGELRYIRLTVPSNRLSCLEITRYLVPTTIYTIFSSVVLLSIVPGANFC